MSEKHRLWNTSPERPELGPNDIHIWRASLDQSTTREQLFRKLLTADELLKADRFRFEKDRRHFTVARGVLRKLLSSYLGCSPATLQFDYSDYGKPSLTADYASALRFNLAHSGGVALYAFTKVGEIGIDLEFIRPEFTGDEIARRYFSAREVASLECLVEQKRHQAFFNCWTRKEAFIKAKGLGLSLGLDQFDVTLAPDEAAAVLHTRWDETEAPRWSLRAIDVGAGFAGAIAIESHDWQGSYFEVAEDLME